MLCVAGLGFALLLGLSTPGSAGPVRSNYALNVILNDSHAGRIDIVLQMQNLTGNGTYLYWARYMRAIVSLGPQLAWLETGAPGGSEVENEANVSGVEYFNFTSYIAPATRQSMTDTPNTTYFATFTAVVSYSDNLGANNRTILRTVSFALNYIPPAAPPFISLATAAVLGVSGAAGVWAVLYVRRRAHLEELYLMHDSGMLIRHWSRATRNPHDSDIMSGMLTVLQEFVLDTWKSSHQDEDAPLEQLRFGTQRVLLARGSHSVLAAVVRGRYLNGLPKRLSGAVQEFERSNADRLADWNGNVDVFPAVDRIAQEFLGNQARYAI
ncbi:MAG TPA: hypothetical protein VEY12_05925 [Thermoplasmata archaeon]|nr:hypothetical protein [Thermoplasmata archaeon]